MKAKKIVEKNVLDAIEKAMENESCAYGYFAIHRKIEDMDFVIYGNNHLSKRGGERGCLNNQSFWIDRVLDLITEDEDVFWTVLDYKEAFLIDEESKQGFFLKMEPVRVNDITINKIYVKTFMQLVGKERFYVEETDGIVAYNRKNKTITDNPAYISKK